MNERFTAFTNRLNKNFKHFSKIMRKQNIDAYRIYDKDIPEFPFAVDIYADKRVIYEYNAPLKPLNDDNRQNALLSVCMATGCTQDKVHYKVRQKQKGDEQYQKTGVLGEDFIITENGIPFWVNLDKYLDTGLFLDHRNTRLRIKNEAESKRFLNLFAYTGSFTVYAAKGGAVYSETVDLSNAYTEWAKKNFKLNNINTKQHIIIRENVLEYIQQTQKQFDLIVIDPPSFSNSKKMVRSFDIQRDHIFLINATMKLLSPNGVLYFSNNLRTFKLANEISEKYSVKDISAQSVPIDFRNKKIHRCWQIKHFQAA